MEKNGKGGYYITMKPIYLDYSASTPLDKDVSRVMNAVSEEVFGNPGSLHSFGQKALSVLDSSRERVARVLDVDFREVVFTSSATEANNLAIRGVLKAFPKKHPKVIISSIEHESVMETALDLEREGIARVSMIPPNTRGLVSFRDIEKEIDENTALVSLMYANNIVGSIEPIREVSSAIQSWRAKKNSLYPIFHTDAAQAFSYLDCGMKTLGVDLLTLSSHKIHGPKGVGALVLKTKTLLPVITGGEQEFGLRSGTEAVPLVAGFALAVEKASKKREQELQRSRALNHHLLSLLSKRAPGVRINGGTGDRFLPNIVNLFIPGKRTSKDLLIALDMNGIAVSSGAACSSRSEKSSHVLRAMGLKENEAKRSIRVSMGTFTTKRELSRFVSVLASLIKTS